MRSKQRAIEVSKAVNLGTMPVFVRMIHRHFEKEVPLEATVWGNTSEYEAPVDLLKLAVADKSLVDDVESIVFTYKK